VLGTTRVLAAAGTQGGSTHIHVTAPYRPRLSRRAQNTAIWPELADRKLRMAPGAEIHPDVKARSELHRHHQDPLVCLLFEPTRGDFSTRPASLSGAEPASPPTSSRWHGSRRRLRVILRYDADDFCCALSTRHMPQYCGAYLYAPRRSAKADTWSKRYRAKSYRVVGRSPRCRKVAYS